MQPDQSKGAPKPWYKKKIVWIPSLILIILIIIGFIAYMNLSRIVGQALQKSFDNGIASDVYELKFENLSINLIQGNISVEDVVMQPREKPEKNYPYINSKFTLTTHQLILENVQISDLIKNNILQLDKIEIVNPEISFDLAGEVLTCGRQFWQGF